MPAVENVNQRISGMLSAKGFEASRINEDLPVQTVYVNRRDENGSWIVTEELNFNWRGNYDEALGAAMWLVEDALANHYRHGMTTAGLMALYRAAGPDPYIRYECLPLARAANPPSAWFFIYQPIPFNAWGYAEEVSHRLCGSGEFVRSRSLAGWQGRYDRYDRHRMESQLFLDRPVKLTRDIRHGEITLPAGSTGKIATHGTDVDSDTCDYAREAPVIFDPEKLPLWRRTLNQILDLPDRRKPLVVAVPYDAMEFVDDDAIYAAYLDDIYAEIR